VSRHTKREFSGVEEDELLESAMDRYGVSDHVGFAPYIDFTGFLKLVASKPWISLLPEDARDHIILQSRKMHTESPSRRRQFVAAAEDSAGDSKGQAKKVKEYIPPAQRVAGGVNALPARPQERDPPYRFGERVETEQERKEDDLAMEILRGNRRGRTGFDPTIRGVQNMDEYGCSYGGSGVNGIPASPYEPMADLRTAVHDLGMAPEDWHAQRNAASAFASPGAQRRPAFGHTIEPEQQWSWGSPGVGSSTSGAVRPGTFTACTGQNMTIYRSPARRTGVR